MQVPLLNEADSQHQAPLADLAEWLSQNLQEDLQGDAMVSSPTHPSRWGPLAPAGIVESKISHQLMYKAACAGGMYAQAHPLLCKLADAIGQSQPFTSCNLLCDFVYCL